MTQLFCDDQGLWIGPLKVTSHFDQHLAIFSQDLDTLETPDQLRYVGRLHFGASVIPGGLLRFLEEVECNSGDACPVYRNKSSHQTFPAFLRRSTGTIVVTSGERDEDGDKDCCRNQKVPHVRVHDSLRDRRLCREYSISLCKVNNCARIFSVSSCEGGASRQSATIQYTTQPR